MKASLPNIGGLPASSDLNYSTSKLIYRISYPTSGGIGIKHDPTYVEHYVPNLLTVSTPVPDFPIIIVYLATFTLSSDGCFQEPILINDYFDLVSSLVFPTLPPSRICIFFDNGSRCSASFFGRTFDNRMQSLTSEIMLECSDSKTGKKGKVEMLAPSLGCCD